MIEQQIARRMREIRASKGLTLERLGKMAGISRGMLSRLENSQCSPPIATLSKIAQALKALADVNRLKIVGLLVDADLCVGALAGHLGISKPAVSQHLQVLRKAGLVSGQKRGYWTHYRVDRNALTRISAELNALANRDKRTPNVHWRIALKPSHAQPPKEADMCQNGCQQPIQIQEKPQNCTPEHVCRCHGETKTHLRTEGDPAPADKSDRSDGSV